MPVSAARHVTHACSVERLWSWNHALPDPEGRCVIYWMARSQRAEHNLALDTAIATANERALPLLVLFNLGAGPPENDIRHVRHMLAAFPELAAGIVRRGAAFAVRAYDAPGTLSGALTKLRPAVVVTDEDALPHARAARTRVGRALEVPLVSVDSDVIVPNRVIEVRQYAARTLRPRIHRALERFAGELGATDTPVTQRWNGDSALVSGIECWHTPASLPDSTWVANTVTAARLFGIADTAGAVDRSSGLTAARTQLHQFVDERLATYAHDRNQPHLDGTSGMSVFVHYGQISPHEVLAAVRSSGVIGDGVAAYVEEFVVRRELAWNYTLHTPDCRDWSSLPEWARRTLEDHAGDPRPVLHSEADMVACATHDPLWNAAQRQMMQSGTMHGYLRMYWAKQLLTWTRTPQEAFDLALRLHDRYSLDARDANSVVGVSWAIGGVHDRAWPERDIFGKVRSMTLASTGRKFDMKAYVARWSSDELRLVAD